MPVQKLTCFDQFQAAGSRIANIQSCPMIKSCHGRDSFHKRCVIRAAWDGRVGAKEMTLSPLFQFAGVRFSRLRVSMG